jgi:hypothetical protein
VVRRLSLCVAFQIRFTTLLFFLFFVFFFLSLNVDVCDLTAAEAFAVPSSGERELKSARSSAQPSDAREVSGWCNQFAVLLSRAVLTTRRDAVTTRARFMQAVVIALIAGDQLSSALTSSHLISSHF